MFTNVKKKAGIIAAAALFSSATFAAEELNLYNWVDYTPDDLIAQFETETGIKVNLDTYDSNETLLAKLKSGATGYDIVVPSQNFVTIMISEGMLEKANIKGMSIIKMSTSGGRAPPGIRLKNIRSLTKWAPLRFRSIWMVTMDLLTL